MPDSGLCLEALSALSGCNVASTTGASPLSPQDFVNIVALREFYKQQGLKQLEYPGVGALSLGEREDPEHPEARSSPPALTDAPGPPESQGPPVTINLEEFFHPQYNYDFTSVEDGDTVFLRGNERYFRPCGWNRVALRVSQKYDGNDTWLGTGKDAWPVSYHAPNMDGSLGIILTHDGSEPGFLDAAAASLTTGFTKGRGVYSTPDIKMAEKYCKVFKSKVDGKMYKVVLQNRINPENRKKCQREDMWLVYVPEGSSPIQTKALVQESIRPYGLLLKQL